MSDLEQAGIQGSGGPERKPTHRGVRAGGSSGDAQSPRELHPLPWSSRTVPVCVSYHMAISL